MRRLGAGIALAVLGGGCTSCDGHGAAPSAGSATSSASALARPRLPSSGRAATPTACSAGTLPIVEVPATNGVTARENLDAQIDGWATKVESGTASLGQKRQYVDLLLSRTQFGGTFDDFAVAAKVAEEAVKSHPKRGEALALRASVASALHRWDDASKDLEKASALGEDVTEAQEGIELSRGGRVDEILAAREARVDERATFRRLTDLAVAQAMAGDFDGADASFAKSLSLLRKGSPFPAAWVYFQRGLMWSEQADRADRGCAFYREALRYLPGYVVANTHLAELELEAGDRPGAIARLRKIVPHTPDPEPPGVLGEILVSADATRSEGEALIAKAKARYETLLGAHGLAFADHGAEFFMGPGADPQRALALALDNLGNRKTGRAYAVAIEAAGAAEKPAERCRLAKEAKALDSPNVGLKALLTETLPGCP